MGQWGICGKLSVFLMEGMAAGPSEGRAGRENRVGKHVGAKSMGAWSLREPGGGWARRTFEANGRISVWGGDSGAGAGAGQRSRCRGRHAPGEAEETARGTWKVRVCEEFSS